MVDVGFFDVGGVGVDVVDGGRKLAGCAAAKTDEALLDGAEEATGFGVGGGDDNVCADHGVGVVELPRGFEEFAVDLQGLVEVVGSEMRSEGEGKAEEGGELSGEKAGAEEPDGDVETCAGDGAYFLGGLGGLEIILELLHVARKLVGGGGVAAQGAGGEHVGARRAAEAKIDAAGIQGGEGAELLGDDKRRVIGEHDAAGAYADGTGACSDVGDDYGGGGAGDSRHVVVFGEPVTPVAPFFSVLR